MFTIFAGLSQFEADLTAQRTREGLAAARARGRVGGRPKVSSDKSSMALKMYDSKDFTIEEICMSCHIGKTTLYRLLENRKQEAYHDE